MVILRTLQGDPQECKTATAKRAKLIDLIRSTTAVGSARDEKELLVDAIRYAKTWRIVDDADEKAGMGEIMAMLSYEALSLSLDKAFVRNSVTEIATIQTAIGKLLNRYVARVTQKTIATIAAKQPIPMSTQRKGSPHGENMKKVLLQNPAVAIDFATVCAKRAVRFKNNMSKHTLRYIDRAKACANNDLATAVQHAIMAINCALRAATYTYFDPTIDQNIRRETLRDSANRKKLLQRVADETAWQASTLTAMLKKASEKAVGDHATT